MAATYSTVPADPAEVQKPQQKSVKGVRRHVRAVALEGDVGSTLGLRFEFLRFRAGGRDGRGSRTKTVALPGSLTVISGSVAE